MSARGAWPGDAMRFDSAPRHQAVIVETAVGIIYELDVWLSSEEVAVVTQGVCMPSAHRLYEPWLRVTCGAEHMTSAGVEIIEQDDTEVR